MLDLAKQSSYRQSAFMQFETHSECSHLLTEELIFSYTGTVYCDQNSILPNHIAKFLH